MKNKAILFAALALAVAGFGCSGESGGIGGSSNALTIKGTIQNAGSFQVYLDKVGLSPASPNLVAGKADADAAGSFTLSFPESMSEGLYRLRVGEQKINLIFDGKESNLTVNGDLGKLNFFQYEVTGSPSSTTYRNIMQKLVAQQIQADDIRRFVDTTANPLTAMLVAVQSLGGNTQFMDIHARAQERLDKTYPGSTYAVDYKAHTAALQQQAANLGGGSSYEFIEEANRKPAPDISLPSPAGKKYSLSDLKGKVVLLDFWASWCRPCRMENPNVVKIYNQYKSKGFTVFSVSLDGVDSRQAAAITNPNQLKEMTDRTRQMWKDAIAKDGLLWDTHVSDLKKWQCAPALLYGVSSIPRTFMIDKEGKIAAVNLRGAEQIEQVLQKLL